MLCLKSQRDYKFKCILLDNRELSVSYKSEQKCEQMLIDIAKIIGLDESKYFSFKYSNSEGRMQWIDLRKTIHTEFGNVNEQQETVVYLCVKYYITDPCKLEHELTRYLFYLQLRKDITERRLWLKFDCAVDLFSYFLQDELGDYNSKRDKPGYASEYEFWPFQTKELEKATEEKHKKLKGMSQASCEMNFLNTVKWMDMYGVDMHKVLDETGDEKSIGLTPTGLVVYKETNKLRSYFWPRIKKLSYKSDKLTINILGYDKQNPDKPEKPLILTLDSKLTCKNLWKSCMDQLNFFKIKTLYEKPAKLSARILSSKQHRSNVYPNEQKTVIKRIPAKKIKQINGDNRDNRPSQTDKVLTANGDLVFNKDSASDSQDDFLRTVDLNKLRQSPTMSTKSGASYKKQKRRESSENEQQQSKRRGRSKTEEHKLDQNPTSSSHHETEDSDCNLLKGSTTTTGAAQIHHSSSQVSISGRRSKHHHHRSSSNASSRTLTNNNDQKRSSSSHRLANQTSGARLVVVNHHHRNKRDNNEDSCSHHETSEDEAERAAERRASISSSNSKRQVRRRKRSKSPGSALIRPPDEIIHHIKYELAAQTNEMSTAELKEIPFFKVETQAPPFRISPHQRHRRISPHRRRSGEFQDNKSSNNVVTFIKDSTAQIVKTNKTSGAEKSAVISKTSKAQTGGGGLSADEANTNIGFSADSGCEDMLVK